MAMDERTAALDDVERRLRRASMGLVLIVVLVLAWRGLNPAPRSSAAPSAAQPAAAPRPPDAAATRLSRGIAAVSSSYAYGEDGPAQAFDGMVEYGPGGRRDRWASFGSGNAEDWISWRFDAPRQLGRVVVQYYTDDLETLPPESVRVEYQDASGWRSVEGMQQVPPQPRAGVPNDLRFTPVRASEFRLVVVHQRNRSSAITEILLPD
jgi:hypothetical protein